MDKLEAKLNELLVTKMSLKLPEGGKKFLVEALPWLALIGGILSALGVLGVLGSISVIGQAGFYGYTSLYGGNYMMVLWMSAIVLVAQAIVSFMAFGPLRRHEKRGWNLIYWLDLFGIVYAVVSVVLTSNIMGLATSLIGAAIGLYLLFQIRSAYLGKVSAPAAKHEAK